MQPRHSCLIDARHSLDSRPEDNWPPPCGSRPSAPHLVFSPSTEGRAASTTDGQTGQPVWRLGSNRWSQRDDVSSPSPGDVAGTRASLPTDILATQALRTSNQAAAFAAEDASKPRGWPEPPAADVTAVRSPARATNRRRMSALIPGSGASFLHSYGGPGAQVGQPGGLVWPPLVGGISSTRRDSTANGYTTGVAATGSGHVSPAVATAGALVVAGAVDAVGAVGAGLNGQPNPSPNRNLNPAGRLARRASWFALTPATAYDNGINRPYHNLRQLAGLASEVDEDEGAARAGAAAAAPAARGTGGGDGADVIAANRRFASSFTSAGAGGASAAGNLSGGRSFLASAIVERSGVSQPALLYRTPSMTSRTNSRGMYLAANPTGSSTASGGTPTNARVPSAAGPQPSSRSGLYHRSQSMTYLPNMMQAGAANAAGLGAGQAPVLARIASVVATIAGPGALVAAGGMSFSSRQRPRHATSDSQAALLTAAGFSTEGGGEGGRWRSATQVAGQEPLALPPPPMPLGQTQNSILAGVSPQRPQGGLRRQHSQEPGSATRPQSQAPMLRCSPSFGYGGRRSSSLLRTPSGGFGGAMAAAATAGLGCTAMGSSAEQCGIGTSANATATTTAVAPQSPLTHRTHGSMGCDNSGDLAPGSVRQAATYGTTPVNTEVSALCAPTTTGTTPGSRGQVMWLEAMYGGAAATLTVRSSAAPDGNWVDAAAGGGAGRRRRLGCGCRELGFVSRVLLGGAPEGVFQPCAQPNSVPSRSFFLSAAAVFMAHMSAFAPAALLPVIRADLLLSTNAAGGAGVAALAGGAVAFVLLAAWLRRVGPRYCQMAALLAAAPALAATAVVQSATGFTVVRLVAGAALGTTAVAHFWLATTHHAPAMVAGSELCTAWGPAGGAAAMVFMPLMYDGLRPKYGTDLAAWHSAFFLPAAAVLLVATATFLYGADTTAGDFLDRSRTKRPFLYGYGDQMGGDPVTMLLQPQVPLLTSQQPQQQQLLGQQSLTHPPAPAPEPASRLGPSHRPLLLREENETEQDLQEEQKVEDEEVEEAAVAEASGASGGWGGAKQRAGARPGNRRVSALQGGTPLLHAQHVAPQPVTAAPQPGPRNSTKRSSQGPGPQPTARAVEHTATLSRTASPALRAPNSAAMSELAVPSPTAASLPPVETPSPRRPYSGGVPVLRQPSGLSTLDETSTDWGTTEKDRASGTPMLPLPVGRTELHIDSAQPHRVSCRTSCRTSVHGRRQGGGGSTSPMGSAGARIRIVSNMGVVAVARAEEAATLEALAHASGLFSLRTTLDLYGVVLSDPVIVLLALGYSLCSGSQLVMLNNMPYYLSYNFSLSPVSAGVITAVFALLSVVARPLGAWLVGSPAGNRSGGAGCCSCFSLRTGGGRGRWNCLGCTTGARMGGDGCGEGGGGGSDRESAWGSRGWTGGSGGGGGGGLRGRLWWLWFCQTCGGLFCCLLGGVAGGSLPATVVLGLLFGAGVQQAAGMSAATCRPLPPLHLYPAAMDVFGAGSLVSAAVLQAAFFSHTGLSLAGGWLWLGATLVAAALGAAALELVLFCGPAPLRGEQAEAGSSGADLGQGMDVGLAGGGAEGEEADKGAGGGAAGFGAWGETEQGLQWRVGEGEVCEEVEEGVEEEEELSLRVAGRPYGGHGSVGTG